MATSPEDSQSIESRLATVRPRLSFRSAVSRVIKSVADQTEKPATPAFRIDKQLQEECVDQFVQFQKKLKALEVEIDKFTGAVRPLGSSSGLIFSAIRLPRRMREIGDIFYANASFIYDTFGESRRSELPQNFKTYAPDNVDRDPGSVGDFPNLLRGLASELREFLDSLRDIPEFSDKALPESLEMFASWLEYRAGGLEEFDYQLHTPALRRYTNSLMAEMEKHLKQTGDALSRFGKDGVLAIKTAQDRAKEQLLNMSTVATFFSGVAATTFQYTADKQGGILDEIVRALWVSSLILSIASAINSQLAMHWRTAMYRSPRSALPMWISICLTQTPLLFLVFAVLTFSVGLVIYTYSSVQGKLVTLCATVLTSFTSLILLAVILWEGGERWQAHKSGIKGEEVGPGVPVVHEPWDPYKRFVNWSRYLLHECRKACKTLFAIFTGRPAKPLDHLPTITPGAAHFSKHGIVSGLGPSATVGALRSLPYESRDSASQSIGTVQPEQSHQESSTSPSRSLKVDTQTVDFASSNQDESNISPVTMYGRTTDHRFSEVAWRLAVDSMERDLLRLLEGEGDDLAVPVRWNSISYHPTSRPSDPVQDLRFAPDGRWLAASTRDESTALWQVDRDLILNSEFAAGHGGIIWDDDGLAFSVSSKDGVTRWEIEREKTPLRIKTDLEAATYFGDIRQAIGIKGNKLYWMTPAEHRPQRQKAIFPKPLRVHDMACIPRPSYHSSEDLRFVVMVCTILDETQSEDAHHENLLSFLGARSPHSRPKDIQPQRRIIIYNITRSKIATEVPVYGEAQHVAVSRNGRFALVSYGPTSSPELWHIRIIGSGAAVLQLCHVYQAHPKPGDGVRESVGRASFGGARDEYVVASTRDGHVYIWETASSRLLHRQIGVNVHDGQTRGEVTGIAWCPPNKERSHPLFVCGTTDGGLVLWSAGPHTEKSRSTEASESSTRSVEPDTSSQAGPSRTGSV